MNLYLISQEINNGHDTFDSCIVSASSEQEARTIHPSTFSTHIKDNNFMATNEKGGEYILSSHDWVEYKDIQKLSVELIGQTTKPKGVILASFNAG